VRRTAGRIAGRVHIIEPEFLAVLLDASMGADLLASDGAAEGAFACWDVGATSWWTRALLTGSDSMRAQAARNLARHSGPSGLRSLMFFLSAAERKVGSSYAFDGRPIKIVSSSTGLTRWSSTSFVAQKWSQGALLPHPENTLESGSRERIRKVTATNLDACMPWILLATGLPSTTTPEHILNWYDQRKP